MGKPLSQSEKHEQPTHGLLLSPKVLGQASLIIAWILTGSILAGRRHMVNGYKTLILGEPWMDPFFASNGAFLVLLLVAGVWIVLDLQPATSPTCRKRKRWGKSAMWLSLIPLLLFALRCTSFLNFPPTYAEPLWFVLCSGLGFGLSINGHSLTGLAPLRFCLKWNFPLLAVCSGLFGVWWYAQSVWYYEHYMLGFNDFGHFSQRVANTVNGQGILLETPVLPIFWDHFNPGLLFLVPLWTLWPSVHLMFVIQAFCLALSAILIHRIATKLGWSANQALLWALAWLLQPALGQMNIAYTYGWHPISIAIPLLLFALLELLNRRYWIVLSLTVLAGSMGEGLWIVAGCFCAAALLANTWLTPQKDNSEYPLYARFRELGSLRLGMSFLGFAFVFLLVYQFSGIAEFQTGRFVALGSTAGKVLLSPLIHPSAFWGELFRPVKAAYMLSLFLPLGIVSLFQGWRVLLATALPFLVLLVWDHVPATCLAFQYASLLLPIMWLATMSGSSSSAQNPDMNSGFGFFPAPAPCALATGLLLSLFVGQLPVSSPSILGAIAATYGEQENARGPETEIGRWLNSKVAEIRQDGGEVLATSRIAAHFVGNRDVETVGQYLLRKPQLSLLQDRLDMPIRHYTWIVLDREESFQQSTDQTSQVFREALANGFQIQDELEALVVMQRLESSPLQEGASN